jgi:large subunit ribosomal protein L2
MALRTYKPTSPARRGTSAIDFSELTKGKKPERSLTMPLKSKGGRNVHGHITTRHQGGGHKRRLRVVDFRRNKDDVRAKVAALEYDPNRTARLALLHYEDGIKAYILAPVGLQVGDSVYSGESVDIRPGNALPLKNIPLGTVIHNIELKPLGGAQMIRSAGSFGQLMAKDEGYAQVRLPSGEVRKVSLECRATIGQLGNIENSSVRIGTAGRARWLGIRPTTRGVVMNPVDHPHGGGEGKSGQGNPHPVSPWGQPAKGLKTRHNKRTNKFIIKRRK